MKYLCFSVEQFLSDREMDPEKMLKSLGFGFSPDTDLSCGRIPDRFLLSPSSADGIDMFKFVLHHPDLHHLLWMWDKNTDAQSASGANNQSTGRKSGQCNKTSLHRLVTSSNKTEIQSDSRAGSQHIGQGHCTRQDNMVVDNEGGWGIYDSDNKENVCDITESNTAREKQYMDALLAHASASESSLDLLETVTVPDRYFQNIDKTIVKTIDNIIDKNTVDQHDNNVTTDSIDAHSIDTTGETDIDKLGYLKTYDSNKNEENAFQKIPNVFDSENSKDIHVGNSFKGNGRFEGDQETYRCKDNIEAVDSKDEATDSTDVDVDRKSHTEMKEEENKLTNDSESQSVGDYKSLGSWSSDSNESLKDVYNVELEEKESLV